MTGILATPPNPWDWTIEEGGLLLPGLRQLPDRAAALPVLDYLRQLALHTAPAEPLDLATLPTTTLLPLLAEHWALLDYQAQPLPARIIRDQERLWATLPAAERHWLNALLTTRQHALLLGFGVDPVTGPTLEQQTGLRELWHALVAPQPLLDVLRQYPACFVVAPPLVAAQVIHQLAHDWAVFGLTAATAAPLPLAWAWPGPLPLPVLLPVSALVAGADNLIAALSAAIAPDHAATLAPFLSWALSGGLFLFLLTGWDTLAMPERIPASHALAWLQAHVPSNRIIIVGEYPPAPSLLPDWHITGLASPAGLAIPHLPQS